MTDSITTLHKEMRACRLCLEAGYAITPGAIFRGDANAEVLLIGQAPGVTEVEAKRPFNAGSGTRLFKWLGAAGWEEDAFRRRHYMTAVTKCYPGKAANGKGDRVPSRAEQKLCRPFLERELTLVNPRLVILVGGLAIKLLFPKKAKLTEVIGTAVHFPPPVAPVSLDLEMGEWLHERDWRPALARVLEGNGRLVVPLPHPSGASLWPNKPANQALIDRAIGMLRLVREGWSL